MLLSLQVLLPQLLPLPLQLTRTGANGQSSYLASAYPCARAPTGFGLGFKLGLGLGLGFKLGLKLGLE